MMLECCATTSTPTAAPTRCRRAAPATLEAAGEPRHPLHHRDPGGIGEDRADRIAALEAIAASHDRWGHVQEVIVATLPKAGTSMHAAPPCPSDTFLEAIALARLILPAEIHLQAPPNLSDDFLACCSTRASTTGAACRR